MTVKQFIRRVELLEKTEEPNIMEMTLRVDTEQGFYLPDLNDIITDADGNECCITCE